MILTLVNSPGHYVDRIIDTVLFIHYFEVAVCIVRND